jgi:thioredoxin reductase
MINPALIVGAGPTGRTAALECSAWALQCAFCSA